MAGQPGRTPLEEAERLYPEALADGRLILATTKEEATEGADALVIFDGRNLYDPERLTELGWTYCAIGREASVSPVV